MSITRFKSLSSKDVHLERSPEGAKTNRDVLHLCKNMMQLNLEAPLKCHTLFFTWIVCFVLIPVPSRALSHLKTNKLQNREHHIYLAVCLQRPAILDFLLKPDDWDFLGGGFRGGANMWHNCCNCHSKQRGTSEISAPCVASKGDDFNVLNECLSDWLAFWSILHTA